MNIDFAILCDGTALESWQRHCLEQIKGVPEARAVLWIERHIPDARRTGPSDRLASLPVLVLAETAPGSSECVTDSALERIRSYQLDFILSFSCEPCPPELLEAARHGVWAYQFGDWVRYRGGPSGFWEVYDAEPVTAALLVRLQRSADARIVLREGYLRTHLLSAKRNREQLLARITRWPAQVCIDLRNGVADCLQSAPRLSTARVRGAPTRLQRLNYRCRILTRAAREGLRSLFRHDQWNVGRIDRPIASFLNAASQPTVHWLKSPRRSDYYADPFGVWRDGRLTILYEHFSYRESRGTIAAIECPEGASPAAAPAAASTAASTAVSTAAAVRIGPQPAVHLSYPYLIDADGRLLCIPESYEAREVGLYALERFPDRWLKVANLLEGIDLVDATVFRHDGTWWLAGSEPTAKGATCELHLWYASSITGPWHPHAGNPVKMDVRSARPGGTPFYDQGVLYRPAQDCTKTYGDRIVINRVSTLTPTAFHETPASTVEPDPNGPYPAGLHTLSSAGEITLIDAKRVIFSPAQFRRVLAHYLRSLSRLAHR